jgi:hypothetical protein
MLHLTLAYIDPQSGTLLLQMIAAGVLGALAYFRRAWLGFFGLFKRSKPKDAPKDSP